MKKSYLLLLCFIFVLTVSSCKELPTNDNIGPNVTEEESGGEEVMISKKINLSIGDSYNFSAMGLTVLSEKFTIISHKKNVITADEIGQEVIEVFDKDFNIYNYEIIVHKDAKTLGDKFELDKGMFKDKKVIAFGDSITDGVLMEPTLNYEDTYFALLSRYLEASSDYTDLENINFACGGTTITYGNKDVETIYGISGVERVSKTEPFYDHGRKRNPYPNILDADLCVIFYGTNDFYNGVLIDNTSDKNLNDYPTNYKDARTIKGGIFYTIYRLRQINPNLKILVLSPLYRRAFGNLSLCENNVNDIYNNLNNEVFSKSAPVINEVCDMLGAKFVNMYPVFNYLNFGEASQTKYSLDGLHPNKLGHELMFEYILDYLKK